MNLNPMGAGRIIVNVIRRVLFRDFPGIPRYGLREMAKSRLGMCGRDHCYFSTYQPSLQDGIHNGSKKFGILNNYLVFPQIS